MPEPKFIECSHQNLGYAWRTYSNGSRHFGTQCLLCGEWKTLPKTDKTQLHPSVFDAPDYDPNIRQQWFNRKREESCVVREEVLSDRRQEMSRYYESVSWNAKRSVRLEFNGRFFGGKCEVCFKATATQCHHVTYARFGSEWIFDIAAVCVDCHALFHPDMNNGITENCHADSP